MALYFYFNETTGDLVYSDQATYSGSGYTSLEQQIGMAPYSPTDWVFHSLRSTIKTVTKDPAIIGNIKGLMFMNNMFSNCSSLTSMDLSGFDTSKVTMMSDMFNGCSSLTSLDLSSFDTSKVTMMLSMFNNCSSLTSLDLSGFDTSEVTSMNGMFHSCSSLVSLDISGFDTSNVTNVTGIFDGCLALRIIDVSDSMENILPKLPSVTYYNVETGESASKESLTKGTWVRDEADISLVSTMVQDRQAVRSLRHMINKLSKRIVALESSVSSLVQ